MTYSEWMTIDDGSDTVLVCQWGNSRFAREESHPQKSCKGDVSRAMNMTERLNMIDCVTRLVVNHFEYYAVDVWSGRQVERDLAVSLYRI